MDIKQIIESALNLIFPPKCGICEKIGASYLCNDCKKIQKSLQINKHIYTSNEIVNEFLFIYDYKDEIRNLIIKYKFNDKSYIWRTFVEAMIDNERVCEYVKKFDLIIPVPLSKKRFIKRGYNQVELIVKGYINKIGGNGAIIVDDLLKKVKEIKPQSTLNKVQRAVNIQNAYFVNRHSKYYDLGKSVLLVDDIYTTGSTINECSKVLKENGFKYIGALIIAKD